MLVFLFDVEVKEKERQGEGLLYGNHIISLWRNGEKDIDNV